MNRLTQKNEPGAISAEHTYDLVGKILQVNDPTGTYAFAYDNVGRLTGTTTTYSFLPNTPYANSYSYDADSNRTGFTAPDGSTNTYTYDTLNRLTTLANSWGGSFGFSYDALSRRTQMTKLPTAKQRCACHCVYAADGSKCEESCMKCFSSKTPLKPHELCMCTCKAAKLNEQTGKSCDFLCKGVK